MKLNASRLLPIVDPGPRTLPVMTDRLLRISDVEEMVGLKRAMIYRLIQRGDFPKQYKPGGFASRWDEAEVRAWREEQRAAAIR